MSMKYQSHLLKFCNFYMKDYYFMNETYKVSILVMTSADICTCGNDSADNVKLIAMVYGMTFDSILSGNCFEMNILDSMQRIRTLPSDT